MSGLRARDEDRWLASRFAPQPAREHLAALYALDLELARVAQIVSNPMAGAVRLRWWLGELEALHGGAARNTHPVLEALAPIADALELPFCQALVEARARDLEPQPFADWAELSAHGEAAWGGVMGVAAGLCGAPVPVAAAAACGRAWGAVQALKTPQRLAPALLAELPARGREALREARVALGGLPTAAFPAIGYLALVSPYLAGRRPALLERQGRLLAAALTGRL